MKTNFLDNLNIPIETKKQIAFLGAVYYKEQDDLILKFFSKTTLNSTELIFFLNSIFELKNLSIKLTNITIEQKALDLGASDFYAYLYQLSKKYRPNLKTADFFIEKTEDKFSIIVLNQETFKIILKDLEKLEKFLKNINLYRNKITIIQDGSKFERKKIFENSAVKLDEQLKEAETVVAYKSKPEKKFKKITGEEAQDNNNVYFEGKIFSKEIIKTKTETIIVNYSLKNQNNIITCNFFTKSNNNNHDEYKIDNYVRVYGNWKFNPYKKSFILAANKIEKIIKQSVEGEEKINNLTPRTELHIHTKMSTMDGIGAIEDYFKYATKIGLNGLAITDHNSVQGFPQFFQKSVLHPEIRAIYGVEFDIFDDINENIVENQKDLNLLDCEYVFFDLETTGISVLNNEIIEFGGIKWQNGQIIDKKQIFIKSKKPIPKYITEITKISDEMLKDASTIENAVKIIKEWLGDAVLVAHNAKFDYSFLDYAFRSNNLEEITNPIIDTLKISWLVNSTLKNHRLGTVARNEGQMYDENISHRGDYDAQILQKTFENMLHKLFEIGIRNLNDFNKHSVKLRNKIFTNHITVLAKNQEGIKDIYKLISWAHINYFNSKKGVPTLPLSLLLENKKNILLGSACKNGLIWEEINYQNKNIKNYFDYFDYIEIFPPSVYQSLVNEEKFTKDEIQFTIKKIISEGKKYNKKIVVSSDAHYVYKEDKEIREIYIVNKSIGGKFHPLYNSHFKRNSSPEQHLKNNDELLAEFAFIDDQNLLDEIIFRNPHKILEIIDKKIIPIKKDLYPPIINEANEKFLELIKGNLISNYGENQHPEIIERFNQELKAITKNNYGIIYYISSLAVKKSLKDGYLVGSRGSVGSSFVATIAEITEVNPLKPHYKCNKCKYHEFVNDNNFSSGFDLPDKICPKCNNIMKGDGHWIPFETFLGFDNAKKIPDIDLNFSRDYQSEIHNYIKELLGEENVFRAGTISTVAERTAYGYVKNWMEKLSLESEISPAKISYLAKKAEGTKRTTGQHPGGLIVVPSNMEIYDFTPINYPGNDINSNWKTTHFDFDSIHDNLLKLDLLGHLDPSSLKMLHELTNIDPKDIPMNDQAVLSLFLNAEALKYQQNFTGEDLGIIGMSEFGTNFVREIVRTTKPKSFSDLVRISGLSHGTDVWNGNAKKLIDEKLAELKDVISVRDDIMTYLVNKGIDDFKSFQIMESIRKGNGLRKEWETEMLAHQIPQWYLDSAKKIKYMFPKAHAIAYVMMAFRISWYKINYPLEYYATYFTKRDTEWDIETLFLGVEGAKRFKAKISNKLYTETERDRTISETYNILLEMYSRGYQIEAISLNKSKSKEWVIDYQNNSLIPPFSIIEGLGELVADKLINARNEQEFISYQDFKVRSGLNKTLLLKFEELGLIKEIKTKIEEESGQTFLFNE